MAMRMRGLEPPRGRPHTDLNRARLPIPPHPRGTAVYRRSVLTPAAPRAPGRVVLGVEVQNDRLAPELRELDGVAAVARELEIGCGLPFLDHLASSLGSGRC